jgi:hypothetical protein
MITGSCLNIYSFSEIQSIHFKGIRNGLLKDQIRVQLNFYGLKRLRKMLNKHHPTLEGFMTPID